MSKEHEVCIPVAEDVELLRSLEKECFSSVYVGSVKYDGAYKDVFVVVMPDRSVHVIEVRRLCHREEVSSSPP